MVVVPVDTLVTTPRLLTVATEVLVLLHTPPGVASVRAIESPVQTVVAPVIAAGDWFTVILVVAMQPVVKA